MSEIVIKKMGVETKLDRENLIEVHETSDGIVFNFKNGLHLTYIDPHMSLETKRKIKVASDSFDAKRIIYNLDNYTTPVMMDCT